MGDYQVWATNGEDEGLFSSSSSSLPNPNPLSFSIETWVVAETTTREIINQIQPTVVSEQRRKAVINYVQRIIKLRLGSEVFPFGSVPLKTYLPDGDIDLTALSIPSMEENLANDVRSVLEAEEQSKSAEFEVKDIQYIHAEVKLVKCLVQDIVVDISFNQLGGLCTLCFLEQVNRVISKNHLFKRSILLIKAWCYYESRILGAHHGLISTYALETLVLYIFSLFKSSLNGPLAVLYRFLDYYSKFDWDNYCVSLNGPVSIACLPEIVETLDVGRGNFSLDKDYLRDCVEKFSAPLKGLDGSLRSFPQKHFNIVDPLRETNNLGRSVSKGNFYRIRSAFTYGARKLGQILSSPRESIANELRKFFMNTLDRHGSGQRPDVQVPFPAFVANPSDPTFSKFDGGKRSEGVAESWFESQGLLCERISDMKVSRSDRRHGTGTGNELHPVAGHHMIDGVKGNTTPRNEAGTLSGREYRQPHLSLSYPSDNLKIGKGNPDHSEETNSVFPEYNGSSRLQLPTGRESDTLSSQEYEETDLATSKTVLYGNHEDSASVGTMDGLSISIPNAHHLEDLYPDYMDGCSASTAEGFGALNSLADLKGDYDSHINSLRCAQWFQEYGFSRPFLPIPLSPSNMRGKHAYDTYRRSMQLKQSMFSHMNPNGLLSAPQFYPASPHIVPSRNLGAEEVLKARGTGTYFPNTNHRSYRDMPVQGRGRNGQLVDHGQLHRPARENGWGPTELETNLYERRGNEDLSQDRIMVFPGHGRPVPPDSIQVGYPVSRGFPHTNDSSSPSEKVEFGTLMHLPPASSASEASRQPAPAPVTQRQGLVLNPPPIAKARPKQNLDLNPEGAALQAYHLKNEADFPPLSIRVRSLAGGQ